MLPHGLIQLRSHRADGAEGAARILEDITQRRAAELAQFLLGKCGEILPFVPDAAPGDPAFAAE